METTSEASTADKLDDILGSLDSTQGAVKSLACNVDQSNGRAAEAWTIHDALRAVRKDVSDLRAEVAE